MLSLILHQLAVCILLFALLILSFNCVDLFRSCQPKEHKNRWMLYVMIVLWITTFFRTLCDGVFLVEKGAYGAYIAGCGVGLLLPVFYAYFKQDTFVKKELVFVLCLYFVSIINVCFFTYYIFDILYGLCMLVFGGYVAMQSASVQRVRQWIDNYFMLWVSAVSLSTMKTVKKLQSIWLDPEKVKRINTTLSNEEVYNSKITLSMFARLVGINRTYVSRYFNERIGIPFGVYMKSQRFKKAEAALRSIGKTVTSAYEEVGLKSADFYRTFKKEYQVSPKEWQRMNREKKTL